MKILFVSSGNSKAGISPIIKNQGESLRREGVDIEYYTIKGKGIIGYLTNINKLRKFVIDKEFELIHAHYSLSALVVILSFLRLPIVVSYMGSDVLGSHDINGKRTLIGKLEVFVTKLVNLFVTNRIVKSKEMSQKFLNSHIIPNGVDFESYKEIEKSFSKKKLGLLKNKEFILFPADPKRPEKNFKLFEEAFRLLANTKYEYICFNDTLNRMTPFFYNASAIVVLTSFHEGSPNVIKEAMACNIPIVSTDVGDVKEIISNTDGCYITNYDPKEIAAKMEMALKYNKKTTGRLNIKHLEDSSIAKKIIDIYFLALDNFSNN